MRFNLHILMRDCKRSCGLFKSDSDHRRSQLGGKWGHAPPIFRKYSHFVSWELFAEGQTFCPPQTFGLATPLIQTRLSAVHSWKDIGLQPNSSKAVKQRTATYSKIIRPAAPLQIEVAVRTPRGIIFYFVNLTCLQFLVLHACEELL